MHTKRKVGLMLAGLLLCSCLTSPPEQRDIEEAALSDTGSTESSAAAIPSSTSHDATTKPAPTTTGPPATTATTAVPTTTATTTPTTTAPTTTNPPAATTVTTPTTTTATAQSADEEGEEGEGQQPQRAAAAEEEEEEEEERQQEAASEETREREEEQQHEDPGTRRVHDVTVSRVEFMPGLTADVHAPIRPGDYPVVTLTFGRGWSIGDRSQLTTLSHYLASQGMVAVNGEYRTLLRNGSLSTMAEEVACLAAAAPEVAKPHLTGPAGPVWLLGYSSGAHLAALATLASHSLPQQCPYASADIAGMIGLGGPYDLDELWNSGVPDYFFDSEALAEDLPYLAPALRRGDMIAMQFFLRLLTRLTPDDTELWDALSPLKLTDRPLQRSFLLITGDRDELIFPLHAERFAEALISGGHHVELRIIPRTDHQALVDPENVGEAIRSFVEHTP